MNPKIVTTFLAVAPVAIMIAKDLQTTFSPGSLAATIAGAVAVIVVAFRDSLTTPAPVVAASKDGGK